MIKGKSFKHRSVQKADVDKLYDFHTGIHNRGGYFPLNVVSQPAFQNQFQESGFWTREEGMLLIVNNTNEILGRLEFFKTVNYLDEYELSYHLYDTEQRSKGIMTEAVNLMVRDLFETKRMNRIPLVIHPDNAPSRRLGGNAVFNTKAPPAGRGTTRAGTRMWRFIPFCTMM